MEFYEKPSLEDIEHYGVLGMKWGVRRTPEQLGHHKIKKGTVMYSTTSDKSEPLFGTKNVTYLPPDRDYQRGMFGRAYENRFELKKDLNVPSRDTLNKVYEKVMANDETKREAIRSGFEALFSSDEIDYRFNYGKDWKKHLDSDVKEFTDLMIKDWENYTVDEKFGETATSVNTSRLLKNAVIAELKKQGYNAMVDEGSVGGHGKYPRRYGVEPLIIFDGNDVLSKTDTTEITDKISREAGRRYNKWAGVANSSRNRKNPW